MREVFPLVRRLAVLGLGVSVLLAAPAAAAPLSLEECVRLSLANNLAVEDAHKNLRVAEADVLGARSVFWPQLSLSGNWSKSEEPRFFEQGGGFAFSDETYSANATASLLLFDGLGNIAGYQQARHNRAAYRDLYGKARQDVVYETERRFFEVLRQTALLEVQEEAVSLSAEQLKKTETMKELGAATQADVYKAEVDHSGNRLARLRSERDLRVAKASLAAYLGLDPREELELAPEELEVPDEHDLTSACAQALELHPGLRSARSLLSGSEAGVKDAKADRYPSFALWYNSNYYNFELKDFDDDHIEYSYGVRLNFTIFDGFLTKSAIRRAEANLVNARRRAENTERDVLFNVNQAYLDLEVSRESIAVAEDGVRSSEEDLRLARERYKIGEGTILEVIDAQVNLTRARTDLVTAVYDRRLAISALHNAVGDMPVPETAE